MRSQKMFCSKNRAMLPTYVLEILNDLVSLVFCHAHDICTGAHFFKYPVPVPGNSFVQDVISLFHDEAHEGHRDHNGVLHTHLFQFVPVLDLAILFIPEHLGNGKTVIHHRHIVLVALAWSQNL